MCISVVGGMKRLEPQYLKEAERMGVELRLFNNEATGLETRLYGSDAIIIFTNMVSHNARRVARKTGRIHGIPVFMHHACGVCTLRECLGCLVTLEVNDHMKKQADNNAKNGRNR